MTNNDPDPRHQDHEPRQDSSQCFNDSIGLERVAANQQLQQKLAELQQAKLEIEEYSQSRSLLNSLLQLSLEEISSKELIDNFLELMVATPLLGVKPSGVVFLTEGETLNLVASHNIPESMLHKCAAISVDECHCGQAVRSGKVILKHCRPSQCHGRNYQGMGARTLCCVPIIATDNSILGVVTFFLADNVTSDQKTEQLLLSCCQVIACSLRKKTTEKTLRERTDLLTSIYTAADNVGLIVTELVADDALITSFSPGAEKMFGYTQEEIIGRSIGVMHARGKKHRVAAAVQTLREGKKVHFTNYTLIRKTGESFPVELTIHPMANGAGEVRRVLGVCLDISGLKQAEEKLKKVNLELEERVEERTLELQLAQRQFLHAEKFSAIGRLSASIAHEFNNPLQGITTILNGVAQRAELEVEDAQLVKAAIGECNRMAGLLRDLQDFNRPTSGRALLIDIHQVIDAILLLSKNSFEKKSITIVKKYGDNMPLVRAVPDQIKQVVLNLLNNAADSCAGGGEIQIQSMQLDDSIVLTIKDDGEGILPEDLSHIFDPFFTTKPKTKGTGLGLSVCYGIIKNHNGDIRVESQPGVGTTFEVFLPITGVVHAP